MITLNVTDRDGNVTELQVDAGRMLMEPLRDEGQGVEAICGGQCSCATCHCFINEDWMARLPEPSEDEQDLLAVLDHHNPESSRLSCQIELTEEMDGLTLTVAPEE